MPCDTPAAYSILWEGRVKSRLAAGEVDMAPGARRGRRGAVGCSLGVSWGHAAHGSSHAGFPLAAGRAPRKAGLAQHKAQENDYSHVFTETAARGRHEFTAASNTRGGCQTLMPRFCQEKERKMGNQPSHRCFIYIWPKKILLRTLAGTLLVIKGLSFSTLNWLNKKKLGLVTIWTS